jgi:hypothetical protein
MNTQRSETMDDPAGAAFSRETRFGGGDHRLLLGIFRLQ